MTLRVAFRRDGTVIGQPNVTYSMPQRGDPEQERFIAAIFKAITGCAPLPFSKPLGAAIAGRIFTFRYTLTRRKGSIHMSNPQDTLVLETTKGKVVIEMRPDLAPGHVAHIKKLVGEKFYDGIVFHRVIDGFMAQTGCPQGTGTGGSDYPDLKPSSTPSRMCAARSRWRAPQNPDSANSQFFICFDDARFLDKQYTVWGKVIEGMDNVDKIKRGEPVRDPDQIVTARMMA